MPTSHSATHLQPTEGRAVFRNAGNRGATAIWWDFGQCSSPDAKISEKFYRINSGGPAVFADGVRSSIAPRLFQERDCLLQFGAKTFQCFPGDFDLFVCLLPMPFFNRLPHPGQGLDPIASVKAGSVD